MYSDISRSLEQCKIVLIVALVISAGLFCTIGFAQEGLATVRLDGNTLFRVGSIADLNARDRARQIEQRLLTVLDTATTPPTIRISTDEKNAAIKLISVAGRTIVTITPTDAEENATSSDVLAAQWARSIETALTRAVERRLSWQDRFLTAIQSSIKTAFAQVLESAILIVPKALAAILVILVFWLIAASVRWLMRIIFRKIVSDLTIENLIKQVGYYAVWALGLIVAASAFGLEPQNVATGLGLTSLALGFALKDILSNFVSGLLILTLRPFKLGDQIIIGDTEGNVERIELRATLIRTYDGRMVAVPNSETFTSRVTNNTASPVRRANVQIFLGYNADLKKAMSVMKNAALETEGVLAELAPSVRVRSLEEENVVLEVRFWTDSRRSDFILTSSNVRLAIIERFNEIGIPLPDPAVQVSLTHKP